ncbi:septation protein SepH [Nocardioides sp.]|uniref:septation protein SepH n=1 Tax=Nocardioides sp. TaxID=35761 RepID=UPI003527C19E
MEHLSLVGMSEDQARLLLVDDAGHEFSLDADDDLRAAVRGHQTRLGQLEIQMESALRPRDIQARIRAGESPEQVAQAAGTTVDKVMVYAGPVLAERAHIAERAQRASVRTTGGEPAARTLGEAVSAQLRRSNVPGDSLDWDAWRREDGRWTLVVPLPAAAREGAAHFTFDAPGNYVVVDDDDARWLVGDLPEPVETPARDDLQSARARRLAAVPAEEQLPLGDDLGGGREASLGDDAIELVADADTEDLSETAARLRAAPEADTLGVEQGAEAFLDGVFARQNPGDAAGEPTVDGASAVADDSVDASEDDEHLPPQRREVKKTRGRASVPSWDEIMFGGGSSD